MKPWGKYRISNSRASLLRACLTVVFALLSKWTAAQQIIWAKVYPLEKRDQISCIAKDEWGDMYVGGYTRRNLSGGGLGNAIVYKLTPNGDTIFSKILGIKGDTRSISVDAEGMIRIGVSQYGSTVNDYNTILLRMTSDGFIFKQDTIFKYLLIHSSIVGKDSSWILVGQTQNAINGSWQDMFFQRIQKDGTIDPLLTFNQGHPDFTAHRVEQLPNGNYLMSGRMGSRIVAYELNEWGLNPVFRQWYQTPDLSNLYSGHVSRINGQRFMIGAQGNPSIIGQYDSLLNKFWLRKDEGDQVPPQPMIDGSVIFGYVTGVGLNNTLYRLGPDSSQIWLITIKDSLAARGISGVMQVNCFNYFDDQSAVAAGTMDNGSFTQNDPIFIKIANVGTPVTSLSKPKKGPLQNETLAPWPNPSNGTLYLKQHFDKAEIHLYQLSGQEVAQYQIRFGQPIQIHQLPAGLYLYRAVIDGKAFSGKIMNAAP